MAQCITCGTEVFHEGTQCPECEQKSLQFPKESSFHAPQPQTITVNVRDVRVTAIDIPFGDLISFMVKVYFASIPVAIVFAIIIAGVLWILNT